jgi:hypothetical protein
VPERSPAGGLVAGRPVHAAAFADPAVVLADDRWWAVASTGPAGLLPTLSSVDLVHWEREPAALGALGGWAVPGSARSPELAEIAPGRWLLFYGAVRTENGSAGIGVGTATDPGGVFVDARAAPLVSGSGSAGATDPAVFTDRAGARWLFWADADGVLVSRLAVDGLGFVGAAPVSVLVADQPWQGGRVAAPEVLATTNGLLLFHEAGPVDGPGRCIGVARAEGPTGPFGADPQPLLVSGERYDGPGHPAVVTDPGGRTWLLFSAWAPGRAGIPGAAQSLWLAALDLDVGSGRAAPTVGDPLPAPTPLPAPFGRWRLPLPDDPTADQERVLRAFTVHGAIRAVPARHHLRVVLLDLLAQLFEPGVRYPEAEVDRRLTGIWAPGIHPDYARLRRLLVDQNFLDRRGGIYRRSGGTVTS